MPPVRVLNNLLHIIMGYQEHNFEMLIVKFGIKFYFDKGTVVYRSDSHILH